MRYGLNAEFLDDPQSDIDALAAGLSERSGRERSGRVRACDADQSADASTENDGPAANEIRLLATMTKAISAAIIDSVRGRHATQTFAIRQWLRAAKSWPVCRKLRLR